jgi:hypothetical protein
MVLHSCHGCHGCCLPKSSIFRAAAITAAAITAATIARSASRLLVLLSTVALLHLLLLLLHCSHIPHLLHHRHLHCGSRVHHARHHHPLCFGNLLLIVALLVVGPIATAPALFWSISAIVSLLSPSPLSRLHIPTAKAIVNVWRLLRLWRRPLRATLPRSI